MSKKNKKGNSAEDKPAENQETKSSGSSTQAPADGGNIGLIVVVAIVVLIMFLWYFNQKKTATPENPERPKETTATSPVPVDAKAKAMGIVKNYRLPKTMMSMESLIQKYREKEQKDKKAVLSDMLWEAKPSQGKEVPDKYYDVTLEWKENDVKVMFVWEVDTESSQVKALNDGAKKLEAFDEELFKTMSKETPTPAPTGIVDSPTPGISPAPSPAPTALKPVKKGGDDIEILPPEVPEEVKTTKKRTNDTPLEEPVEIPSIDFNEEFYQLDGVLTSGSEKKALMSKEGKNVEASVGTKLPDGWTVSVIGETSVTLKKGSRTKVVNLKQGTSAPSAPSSGGAYPKASPAKPSVNNSGPPSVPAPGEAPQVPPAAPKKPKTPTDTPTVIPLE